MDKRKQRVTKWLTWLVLTAQICALFSTATVTTFQPTPQLARAAAQQAGLGEWGALAAAKVAGLAEAILGAPKIARAEAGSFQLSTSGNYFTCALDSNGGVMCWGLNNLGQLGNGTTTNSSTPVQVTGLTSGVVDIAAGANFACALTSTGGVKCWGDNAYGQLGDANEAGTNRSTPVDVYHLQRGVAAIDAGSDHMCALMTTGGVKCWGRNSSGQIGDGAIGTNLWPADVVGLQRGVVAISAGQYHTCAVLTDGTAKCWGADTYGGLGNVGGNSRVPDTVAFSAGGAPLTGVLAISSGVWYTCAVLTTNGVKCWGYNSYGQLGDGTTTNRVYPVDVSGLSSGVATISTGTAHTCAVLTSGGLNCWGHNGSGQLGDGSTVDRLVPTAVSGLTSGVAAISANTSITGNGHFTCAALTAGGVKCWGSNTYGQLGDGTTTQSNTPVNVAGGFTGYQITLAFIRLIPGDRLDFGARALNAATVQSVVVYNPSATALTMSSVSLTGADASHFAISGGTCGSTFPLSLAAGTTCTVQVTFTPTSLGGKYATLRVGSNAGGAAGTVVLPLQGVGANIGAGTPTITSDGGLATANVSVYENGLFVTTVQAQGAATLAFAIAGGTDGSRFTIDTSGNLRFATSAVPDFENPADSDSNNVYEVMVSVQNGAGADIQQLSVTVQDTPDALNSVIATSKDISCAVTSGGGVACWGSGTTLWGGGATVPTVVSGLTGVVAVTAGIGFVCALLNTGGVKCWGDGGYGQLGNGSDGNSPVPVDVTGLTSGVVAIDAQYWHACALLSTGGMKCWGNNLYGQLGNGSTTNSLVPVDVTGLTSGVTAITAGRVHSCAVLTDGKAKCWGFDTYGALGNVGGNSTTPVYVMTDGTSGVQLSGVRTIDAGYLNTCAVLTTGAVKCWGWNDNGELGDGTTTNSSDYPVNVPALPGAVNPGGVGVATLKIGADHVCAVLNDGSARCWGINDYGTVGDGVGFGNPDVGNIVARNTPVRVTGMATGVIAIAPSDHAQTCAVTNDGDVKCWGYNLAGALGIGYTGGPNGHPHVCTNGCFYYPVLTGTAAAPITVPTTPVAAIAPSGPLAFGNQTVNTTAPAQTVTISNTGATPLTLYSANIAGSHYAISGGSCATPFPVTVNVGASCTLQVTFTPLSVGSQPSTLTISSNSGGVITDTPISLSGTGVSAAAPVLLIGKSGPATATQGTNFSYTLVVTNTGTVATSGTVTVTDTLPAGLSFVSGSGGGFTCTVSGQNVTCTSSSAIAASNGTATITLTVNPTTTGAKSNTASAVGGGDTSSATSNTVNTTVMQFVPGCVDANLALWLKANAGTNTTTNGATVTAWQDQVNSNVFVNTGTPNYVSNAINFNPSINLDGVDETLVKTAPTGLAGFAGTNPRTVFVVTQHSTAAAGQTAFYLGANAPQTRQGMGVSVNATGQYFVQYVKLAPETNVFATDVPSFLGMQAHILGSSWSVGSVNASATQLFIDSAPQATSTLNDGPVDLLIERVQVGARRTSPNLNDSYYNGQVAEVITYGRVLSNVEQQQVESYLALKYGITRGSVSMPLNYTNSLAQTVWNATNAPIYNNDIAGIGRDDCSALYQKQSKSINADALVTIGAGSQIAATNIGNTAVIAGDRTSLIWGNDNGNLATWTTTEAPTNYQRLGREWLVQETGNVGGLLVQAPDNSSVLATKLPSELVKVYLLIDADGNFGSGAVTKAMTLNGTNWEVSLTDAELQNGDFFTFATELPNLLIGKSGPATATQGTNFSYTLAVTNTGTVATSGTVTVTDTLPTGLSFVSGSGGGFTCSASGQVVTCTSSSAIAATNGTASITLTVNPTTTGAKSNTASVVGGGDTSAATSNTVNTTVNAAATAPTITSNGGGATASINVAENDTTVTTVTASGTAPIAYSIVGGADAAKFTIDANTGVLSFVSAPDYENPTDSGGNNVYDVTVRASNSAGTDDQAIAVTVTDVSGDTTVTLPVKVFLQGPYLKTTGLMTDTLRSKNLLPTTSPYTAAAATTSAGVFAVTGNHAIVDWVLVEVRNATTPATVVASQSALLQRDGDVVGMDGVSTLSFTLAAGNYHVVVKHRNHLGAMTAAPVALSAATGLVNFTTSAGYGTNGQIALGSVYALWMGNANGDNRVIAAGPNNDRNGILAEVLAAPGNSNYNTNYILTGYTNSDLNLDGRVIAAGPGNDVNLVIYNVFTHPLNSATAVNFIVQGQVPAAP